MVICFGLLISLEVRHFMQYACIVISLQRSDSSKRKLLADPTPQPAELFRGLPRRRFAFSCAQK
jgi:hypothetical protein